MLVVLCTAAGCGAGDSDDRTAPTPPRGSGQGGVRLVNVGEFEQPLYVAQPPGDESSLFVVEQTGRVIVVRDGTALERPFLDLSERVSCCGEQGLLSIAFAPDYRQSGRFYVDYTDVAGDTRVVEYRRSASDPLVADPASERVVLAVDQPYANHNGGLVLFGPDEYLYVGLGDGGSGGDPDRVALDLSNLLGKILRIDPRPAGGLTYSVPPSNPLASEPDARPEVYAYGLRNPWRFSFDPANDALWIGDVGQSELEEIDAVPFREAAGANFGWSAYEGDARYNEDQEAAEHVPPVLTYSHDDGCSVTGGHVVRDRDLPALYGRYLYGDYCAGQLRSFPARVGEPARDDRPVGLTVPSLSSFGTDQAGHVYATSLEGPVYRLAPTTLP